jgi:hypothetical protein
MKSLAITAALILCSVSLFGAADLVTTVSPPDSPLRAGYTAGIFFQVHNNGPDVATAVTLSISSNVPNTCSCDLGDIPPGQNRGAQVSFVTPSTDTTIIFTGTASSNTPDPNPANNSASATLTVSADPDVFIGISVPFVQDLSLPFPLMVFLGNSSKTTAHDVEATIDFPTAVAVQSLPEGCSSVVSTRSLPRQTSPAHGFRFSFWRHLSTESGRSLSEPL